MTPADLARLRALSARWEARDAEIQRTPLLRRVSGDYLCAEIRSMIRELADELDALCASAEGEELCDVCERPLPSGYLAACPHCGTKFAEPFPGKGVSAAAPAAAFSTVTVPGSSTAAPSGQPRWLAESLASAAADTPPETTYPCGCTRHYCPTHIPGYLSNAAALVSGAEEPKSPAPPTEWLKVIHAIAVEAMTAQSDPHAEAQSYRKALIGICTMALKAQSAVSGAEEKPHRTPQP